MKAGVALIDILTGLYATNGILAALHQRNSTSQGQVVEISLLDVQIAALANQAAAYLATRENPERHGNAHPSIVPYQSFAAADGMLAVAVGNAPFIVFDDADLDAAVEGAIASKFRNAGRTCVCANRIHAQAGIYDTFVQKLVAAAAALKVGDGARPDTQLGPLIDDSALRKVDEHIADAIGKGAVILTGGERLGGRFFTPTVLRDVTPDMIVTREETFGPLAPVIRFENDKDAIALANASEFGLAAYFYARDIGRIWKVAEPSKAESSASTPGSSRPRPRRSAGSRRPVSAVRDRNMASRIIWRSNISA